MFQMTFCRLLYCEVAFNLIAAVRFHSPGNPSFLGSSLGGRSGSPGSVFGGRGRGDSVTLDTPQESIGLHDKLLSDRTVMVQAL